jgi:hypothetical protein
MEQKRIISVAILALVALVVLAVVPPPASMLRMQAPQRSSDTRDLVLGTYEGITPCADCPGIRTDLTLVKDTPSAAFGTYRLSLTYLDRDVEPYVAAGTWTTEHGTPEDPEAVVFVLDPDKPDRAQRYRKLDDTSIRQLDRDGREIDPSLPFTLTLLQPS